MIHRTRWRSILSGLISSAMLILASSVLGAEKLIWLLRDLPPLVVVDGPQKGQGVIDQLMPVLMANMPQYQHVVVRVNRARALQMLQSHSRICDPTLIWNPARARWVVYSTPVIALPGNGLAIQRQDQLQIAPFVSDGKVDLTALLNSHTLKLGVIAKRSYGEVIDRQLPQSPANQIFIHYGGNPMSSLLRMQQAGRLQALLGYWPEIQVNTRQQGLPPDSMIFYPVLGAPALQSLYIGCADTPEGRQIIARVNGILADQGREVLIKSKAQWFATKPPDDHPRPVLPAPANAH